MVIHLGFEMGMLLFFFVFCLFVCLFCDFIKKITQYILGIQIYMHLHGFCEGATLGFIDGDTLGF